MNSFARSTPLPVVCLSLFLLGGYLRAEEPPPAVKAETSSLVARTVLGIVSFSRWPAIPDAYRLCAKGDPGNLRQLFDKPALVGDRRVVRSAADGGRAPSLADCDILYLGGGLSESQRRQWLALAVGNPVLTISEQDGVCGSGSMFCLDLRGEGVALLANLDAISRSGIRVNPRVLQLTRRKAENP